MTDTSWAQWWGKERAGDESPEPKESGGASLSTGPLSRFSRRVGSDEAGKRGQPPRHRWDTA